MVPSPSLQVSNGATHTSPMHAQVGVPSQACGIGEHCCVGSCATFEMQTSSSGQSAQLGTTSQSSAGTHRPVQQLSFGSTLGALPTGQSGGVESQVTS